MMALTQSEALRIKARCLIDGLAIQPRYVGSFKERTDHLYRHDDGTAADMTYPQELVLSNTATSGYRDWTTVNVRVNAESPVRLTQGSDTNEFYLECEEATVQVEPMERPPYYDAVTSRQVKLKDIVQHLGTNALGVVPNNYCSYFANDSECSFCEIEPSFRAGNIHYPRFRKSNDDILEALGLAVPGSRADHLILTAGNLPRNDSTARYYCELVEGARSTDGGQDLYIYASIMPPEDKTWMDRLKSAGLSGVGYNLEFFDPERFEHLAPGKFSYGRQRMLDALDYAVDCFGAGNSFTNFVLGIQTWSDSAEIDWPKEVAVALEAAMDMLRRGVVPIFTIYHTTGTNRIGPIVLDFDAIVGFHELYGALVRDSQLVPPSRGVLFDNSTISNHVCNDALSAAREVAARVPQGGGLT